MALSAALPLEWPVLKVYFAISLILSLVGWTSMARTVRGRFLAMREEDFILSARLTGSSEGRIILVHMVPSFLSYIIAILTLAVPYMILSETSLSFIGLGIARAGHQLGCVAGGGAERPVDRAHAVGVLAGGGGHLDRAGIQFPG